MKVWTQRQEQNFQALAAERAAAMKEMEAPLKALIARVCTFNTSSDAAEEGLLIFFKHNAGDICDALKPFDTGLREAKDEG